MQALSLLIKPASGNCNMRCEYCFYNDVSESREMKNRGRMTEETLELLVKKVLSEVTGWCSFGFQGGEPMLMGLPFYEKLIEFQKKYNVHHIQIDNSIQTNGTLMTDEWAQFFAQNRFLVGLSIDGNQKTHDKLRLDAAGNATFGKCISAAEILTRNGADFNILSVVTKPFAADPDSVYEFYKKYDFHFIQFIACMDNLNEPHGSNPHSLDADSYGQFLNRIFDLWYDDFITGDYYSIRQFDNYVRMLMGEAPDNCAMTGHCQSYPVVEADGSVYPCDFYALDEYKIGDVRTGNFYEMLNSDASVRFMEPSGLVHEKCKACAYGFICRGGCRRDREPVTGGVPALNCYCEAYQQFFAHCLPRMADIAKKMPRRT
ncbi:Anaerobic sulfatase-maturating enzyme [Methanosarcinaceae archaeon Ag5]|uniref:Anaerobic sulfatase-maturating enzyme n=1 Tax=Methanolapillus africanus TaxID=3028297 RepID=A0AAE4SD77_9EURY|nr:Anaerobic sulfatase-maturating enzyme [Methanosarcinaceae archaeon Ag5]